MLAGSDALDPIERPAPGTWSVLEYACHVRDVHRIFERRLALMLDEDDPGFANWDQDATAVAETYAEQVPDVVAAELVAAADAVAEGYDAVPDDAWERTGRRSNGSIFTTLGLDRYHLHDLVHHAWDVRAAAAAVTRASYDAAATAYGTATATLTGPVLQRLDRFAELVGPGGRVLEIGCGAGRDAAYLEDCGLRVRRTDVTPGFVELNRAGGHEAEVLDPLVDDLTDPVVLATASGPTPACSTSPARISRACSADSQR